MPFDSQILASWYAVAPYKTVTSGPVERPFCGSGVRVSLENGAAQVVPIHGGAALPASVVDGVIFAWFDPAGRAPTFTLASSDTDGWTARTYDALSFKASPALVMRDLADIEHFTSVHRYQKVDVREGFTVAGPACSLAVDFRWPLIPNTPLTLPTAFASRSTGVGYQLTVVTTAGGAFETRHLVLPTPVDRDTVCVTLGLDVRFPRGGVAARAAAAALHPVIRAAFRRDVRMDAELWEALHRGEPSLESDALSEFAGWVGQFEAIAQTEPGAVSHAPSLA